MNDWGYACFAQLLGDDIISSVGQIKLGVAVPSTCGPIGRCELSSRQAGERRT